jgi:hypothetical protein
LRVKSAGIPILTLKFANEALHLRVCFSYDCHNKQRLFSLNSIDLAVVMETWCVVCEVGMLLSEKHDGDERVRTKI